MPQIYQVKNYQPNSVYHVYNRGAHGAKIFRSNDDYYKFRYKARKLLKETCNIRNFVFCLLPNHYHLEIWQKNSRDIVKFMRSLLISYGMYFAKKYDHSGCLFQGSYKARLLRTKEEQDQVKLYILNNPITAGLENWEHVGVYI